MATPSCPYFAKLLNEHYARLGISSTLLIPGWPLTFSTPKVPDAGVQVGSITGWRLWRVDGHRLRSVVKITTWPSGVPMTGNPDQPPAGVYAFRDPADAWLELQRNSSDLVLGSVKMWGRYVEHERGYRAEFAKITSLVATSTFIPDTLVNLDALRCLYLGLRCPDSLTQVVDRTGRVVGVTSLKPAPVRERWVPYLNRVIADDPPPVRIMEPTLKQWSSAGLGHTSYLEPISCQTHWWRGRSLLLEDGQDQTWLPGWLPLP